MRSVSSSSISMPGCRRKKSGSRRASTRWPHDIALAAPMHVHGWQKLPLADHPNLRRWLTERIEPLPCWQKMAVYEGFATTCPH
jgi:hypothetical protein